MMRSVNQIARLARLPQKLLLVEKDKVACKVVYDHVTIANFLLLPLYIYIWRFMLFEGHAWEALHDQFHEAALSFHKACGGFVNPIRDGMGKYYRAAKKRASELIQHQMRLLAGKIIICEVCQSEIYPTSLTSGEIESCSTPGCTSICHSLCSDHEFQTEEDDDATNKSPYLCLQCTTTEAGSSSEGEPHPQVQRLLQKALQPEGEETSPELSQASQEGGPPPPPTATGDKTRGPLNLIAPPKSTKRTKSGNTAYKSKAVYTKATSYKDALAYCQKPMFHKMESPYERTDTDLTCKPPLITRVKTMSCGRA